MRLHDDVLELAGRQFGLVCRDQLRELGLRPDAIVRLARSRDWVPVTDRVARRAGAPVTVEQRVLAAVLDLGGDAALSHLPGGHWYGLQGCSLTPLHLVTTQVRRHRPDGVWIHRVRELPPTWVTVHRGVPIVRPELLAIQLFAVCRPERAEVLVDRLWSLRLLSGPSIAAVLAQLGARGRNGIAGLRSYLDERGPDYIPPATNLENRVKRILGDAGVEMRRQVNSGDGAWTGRVDFRSETLPVILEVQSETYHAALVDQIADDRRRAALEADGFVVVEAWDTDVWTRPRVVVDAVEAALLAARTRTVTRQ